jgi:hypothetical protein
MSKLKVDKAANHLVDWTRVQALDSNIRQCIEYLQANKKPHMKETGHNPMIREYNRIKLINNILYRITTFSKLIFGWDGLGISSVMIRDD